MIEFDAVDGRRVQVRSSARAHAPHGLAKLVPAGAAGGLSSEVVGLAYGPAENLRTFVEMSQLRELERERVGSGTAVLYAVPSGQIAESGLPAETRMGMFEVGSSIAHGYFYRPFNRLSDVVTYFAALAPRQGLRGVTVPTDRFQVLQESYTTTVPDLGIVSIEQPRGVPASRRRTSGGSMWVDRVPGRLSQVVYENQAMRLSFRPPAAPDSVRQPEQLVSPEFERAVVDFTGRLTAATWS